VSYLPVQCFDSGSHRFDYFSNALDFVPFYLQLVNLLQYAMEASYFGIGHLDRIAGSVILGLRRRLSLRVELCEEESANAMCAIARKRRGRSELYAGIRVCV
jgi:hypothetical protein